MSAKSTIEGNEQSIGFVTPSTKDGDDQRKHRKTSITTNEASSCAPLTNAICLLLYCGVHRKVAVRRYAKSRGIFFPLIRFVTGNESWRLLAQTLLCRLLRSLLRRTKLSPQERQLRLRVAAASIRPQLFDVYRVQSARSRRFVCRVTFSQRFDAGSIISVSAAISPTTNQNHDVSISPMAGPEISCLCQVCTPTIQWFGERDPEAAPAPPFPPYDSKLWGPEVAQFFTLLRTGTRGEIEKFELRKNYVDCSVRAAFRRFTFRARGGQSFRAERLLLRAAKYTKSTMTRLSQQFVTHCFPSRYMSFYSFKQFATLHLGWRFPPGAVSPDSLLWNTFKSFNLRNTGYLSVDEMLLGLAAFDTHTPNRATDYHFGLRLGYLFRYYTRGDLHHLELADLSAMNAQLLGAAAAAATSGAGANGSSNGTNTNILTTEKMENELSAYFTSAISQQPQPRLNLEQFVAVARGNKLFCRLSGNVCRAPCNVLLVISTRFDWRRSSSQCINAEDVGGCNRKSVACSIASHTTTCPADQTPCVACQREQCRLSPQIIRISLDGSAHSTNSIVGAEQIISNVNTTSTACSKDEMKASEQVSNQLIAVDGARQVSLRLIAIATDLLDRITRTAASGEPVKWWFFDSRAKQLQAIRVIFEHWCRRGFGAKIVAVPAPALIFVGSAGNIRHLVAGISYTFCRHSPSLNPANCIFLGNLLGGSSSSSGGNQGATTGIDCLLYVLCMKICASSSSSPTRFVAIRGAAESATAGPHPTNQIGQAFFPDAAEQEFAALLNDLLAQLPVAAVVEDRIFCSSHGFATKSLRNMNGMLDDCAISRPQNIKCIRDIIWSKMCPENDFKTTTATTTTTTANATSLNWNDENQFRRFCRANRLVAMIRSSHKLTQDYALHFNNRIISICGPRMGPNSGPNETPNCGGGGGGGAAHQQTTYCGVVHINRKQIRIIRLKK